MLYISAQIGGNNNLLTSCGGRANTAQIALSATTFLPAKRYEVAMLNRRIPAAALLAAALTLTACGTTNRAGAHKADGPGDGGGLGLSNPSPGASSTPLVDASGRPLPTASASASTGGGGTTSTTGGNGGGTSTGSTGGGNHAGGGALTGDHQGVTATTVKVGFIVVKGSSSYGNGAAFKSPAYGDVPKQVNTIVAWINAHGGVAGRKVVPVIREHDINNDSRTEEEGICTGFTEDDKVFAVVFAAQGYPETRRCYAQHHTLILDPTPFLYGADSFRLLSPYYWSPDYVNYSRVMRALVPALKEQSFFSGSYTLGVVTYDVDVYHSIVDNDLKPALQAAGVTLSDSNVKYISNADIPTIQRGATQAVAQMQVAGVNRVVFAGLGPYAPLFMSTAEGAHFTPRYGVTSYDQPRFDQNWKAMNPTSQLKGAVGIGFSPVQDVADGQLAFPQPGERTCLSIYGAAGIHFAERADSGYALAYCDSMQMLQHAASAVGSALSVQSWAAAAGRLGTGFQSSIAMGTSFAGGRMDGGNGFRTIKFDDGCACFVYTSSVRRFD